jgi:hypothetical protein
MITKQHILNEIKRTAAANGGNPLGTARFLHETGIRESDWFGRYWSRWGDALQEAELSPNKLREAYGEEYLLDKYIELVRELGRVPVKGELRMKRRSDPSFPNDKTFERYGGKAQLLAKIVEYCRTCPGHDDVLAICAQPVPDHEPAAEEDGADIGIMGFVYLLKAGRYYKIGMTNDVGRRAYEMAIQLPAKARTVHVLQTDDPSGIEAYWHKRFANKRANGEWFELDAADVKAFRRRRFM